MTTVVADIMRLLEEIAPMDLAESWDNPGLQVGRADWPVEKILVSLDPTPKVMTRAVEASVDLLITHHPLIFRPLKSIDLSSPVGKIINAAVENTIAVCAVHTNYDSAVDGLNDALMARIGLKNVSVLSPHAQDDVSCGLGRIGDLPNPTDLLSLCRTLKKTLGLKSVRMIGDSKMQASRIAVCSGSGSGLLERFFSSDAQVFITGDIRYHDAREVEDRGRALIDIGHFGSEHIMVTQVAERLKRILSERQIRVEVFGCEEEKDPFVLV